MKNKTEQSAHRDGGRSEPIALRSVVRHNRPSLCLVTTSTGALAGISRAACPIILGYPDNRDRICLILFTFFMACFSLPCLVIVISSAVRFPDLGDKCRGVTPKLNTASLTTVEPLSSLWDGIYRDTTHGIGFVKSTKVNNDKKRTGEYAKHTILDLRRGKESSI